MANAHDLLMAQHAAMMGGKPYLRRVAYLESHGTEFLNLLIPTNYYDYEIKIAATRGTGQYVFGWFLNESGSLKAQRLIAQSSSGNIAFYQPYYNTGYSFNFTEEPITLSNNKGSQYVNGTKVSSLAVGVEPRYKDHIHLFCQRQAVGINASGGWVSDSFFIGKIFHAKFFEVTGGDLVRSLISVLDLSGRPAMYDEVSGQLFHNQGTGEFTWGELET